MEPQKLEILIVARWQKVLLSQFSVLNISCLVYKFLDGLGSKRKKRLFKVKEQFCRNGWEGERCCCSYFQTLDIDPSSAAAAPRLGRPRPLWVHVRLLFKFNLISLFSGRARRRKPRREISYGSVNWISVSSTFLFKANKSIGSQLSRSNEILKGHLLNYRKTHQSMTWY